MKLAPIENLLGHSFRSPDLLIRALTHRSWAHENADPDENETLEFLGDSVVG
jgi:ribonuclease-3